MKDLTKLTPVEIMQYCEDLQQENEKLKEQYMFGNTIIHNMVVANQAAWLEWESSKDAEKAMTWIYNGLLGPGHIPDNTKKQTPQQWFDSNFVEHHKHKVQ